MTTYLAVAASPKHLRDHFAAGIDWYTDRHHLRPAECRTHPETAALLTDVDSAIELVPDAKVAKWNLYFGPRPAEGATT